MAINQVLSQTIEPSTANLSSRFKNAIAFFINAPFAVTEIEIDVFLQIYLSFGQVRNIPLGKIEAQTVLLNEIDTETCSFIPEEYQDTDLEMALLFLPSESFYLEVFVINKEVNLTDIKQQLEAISQQLADSLDPTSINNLIDTVADIAFVTNLALPLLGLPSLPISPITPRTYQAHGATPGVLSSSFPLLPGLP